MKYEKFIHQVDAYGNVRQPRSPGNEDEARIKAISFPEPAILGKEREALG